MIEALLLLSLVPQDLFEREAALRRDLSPAVDPGTIPPKSLGVDLDTAGDFGCGTFDLEKSFKSLFDRNMAEEFLGGALSALQGELARSPLVLACYASPTVCDALKHYRVTANSMLGMELDSCRALETGLEDAQRLAGARAVKRCLEDHARRGEPLDRARRACRNAGTIRGFDGKGVSQIDLNRELDLPERLVPGLRLGAGTLEAQADANAVVRAYQEKRVEARRRWEEAIRNPETAEVDRLGPVDRGDVRQIALLESGRREAVVESLSSAAALSELLKEVHRTERILESAEIIASPELRGEMERRRRLLRNEIGRLVEAFEMERRLSGAVSRAQSVAAAEEALRAKRRLDARRSGERTRTMEDRLKPWGCDVRIRKP